MLIIKPVGRDHYLDSYIYNDYIVIYNGKRFSFSAHDHHLFDNFRDIINGKQT